jgi:hypothetical protein
MSSVVIEASWMGVRSGILNPEVDKGGAFADYYIHERNSGMAEIINQNPQAIKKWISTNIKKGKNVIQNIDSQSNFESNREGVLPPLPLLRTGLATFTASGSRIPLPIAGRQRKIG